jgi:hypothetical protein
MTQELPDDWTTRQETEVIETMEGRSWRRVRVATSRPSRDHDPSIVRSSLRRDEGA